MRDLLKKILMTLSPTYRKVDAIQAYQLKLQSDLNKVLRMFLSRQDGIADSFELKSGFEINHMAPLTPNPKNTEHWHMYYNLAEKVGKRDFGTYFQPVLDKHPSISYEKVLDFACGFGRIAEIFASFSDNITLCDINKLAIDHCKKRFADYVSKQSSSCSFEFCVSDNSLTLPFDDKSFSFIYSWDAMVHFSYKWFDYYLGEFYRISRTGAYVFIHHSNLANVDSETDKSENWADNPHGRTNITAHDIARLAKMHGFRVVEQNVIDWGITNLDCITLLMRES